MVLLADEAQVEACLGPFGDSANLDARLVHMKELLRDVGHVEARFGLFRDSVDLST